MPISIKRVLLLVLPFVGCAVLTAEAAAKTIRLEPVSRSVLRDECLRASGKPVAIDDENAAYGCAARYAVVSCTPDGDCIALVRDTMPVVGNGLRAILRLGQHPETGSRAVQPVDARINAATTP